MPWTAIITFAIQVIGMGIAKSAQNTETEKKFLDLVTHLQERKLVSANYKVERASRLERLRNRTDQDTPK